MNTIDNDIVLIITMILTLIRSLYLGKSMYCSIEKLKKTSSYEMITKTSNSPDDGHHQKCLEH